MVELPNEVPLRNTACYLKEGGSLGLRRNLAADPALTPETAMEGVTSHTMVPLHNETTGEFMGTVWDAVNNFTWMPVNIHRLVGNIAFGGSIVAAYGRVPIPRPRRRRKTKHTTIGWAIPGNFIALCGLIPLPFLGYWLGREIYMFNNTMGINMMGSLFSWLFYSSGSNDWGPVYWRRTTTSGRAWGELKGLRSMRDTVRI